MISDSTNNDSVKSEIYIYLKFCLWAGSPSVHGLAQMAVPKGELPSFGYGWLLAPRQAHNTHFHPPHHILPAATESWEKGTRPWSDKGIRMEQKAAPLRSFSIVTILLWWQNHTHWKQTRTHTAASCPLLSQDHSSLSLFVCQPHTGKQSPLKMEVHSLIVEKCLVLPSGA